MFRPLYDWVLRMAHHRHAIWLLGAVSFAESSFFPIPPDAMLIPMVLARREQAFRIALVCTIASVLGGMLGYYIGYGLMQTVGQWIVHTYHLEAKLQEAIHAYQSEYGTWIILLKGLTPIPFKLVTIASGAASFNFPLFVILCTITRGARFFLVAALLRRFGAPVQEFIEKRLDLFAWGFLALVVLGFAAIALL
ncbi:MAG: DedA family protein [Sphingomonas sp.]|uniref:YqaA family protein n=1 Tax=unclassified Sphingomonas TaxID=196159 RepID=UPI0024549171|nr:MULTISPECIES: YqaA family protein [unclassified Sphingomonas]MBQ1496723.1 DedA family protein [Sphingomonas sp.]MDH4744571.1 DedA family protein [Sphingomonas sp. CBMAI 2297]